MFTVKLKVYNLYNIPQSAGTVEYTDCTSVVG